jgi:hypothetical protein
VVSRELRADDVDVALDHVLRAVEDVVRGDVLLDAIALAVDAALAHAGQVDDGLAQRLRRDRARVRADAADHLAPVDVRDAPAQLRGLNRRLLPAGPGTDHDEVVVIGHAPGNRRSRLTAR